MYVLSSFWEIIASPISLGKKRTVTQIKGVSKCKSTVALWLMFYLCGIWNLVTFNQAISKLQCSQTASYMRKPQAQYETVIVWWSVSAFESFLQFLYTQPLTVNFNNNCCVPLAQWRLTSFIDPKHRLTFAVTEESGDVPPQNKSKTCRVRMDRYRWSVLWGWKVEKVHQCSWFKAFSTRYEALFLTN